MGGYVREILKSTAPLTRNNPSEAYRALVQHPNFEFAALPNGYTEDELVDYIIESIANFVSPSPKVEDEHEEFSCQDIAEVIRTKIKKAIDARRKLAKKKR